MNYPLMWGAGFVQHARKFWTRGLLYQHCVAYDIFDHASIFWPDRILRYMAIILL